MKNLQKENKLVLSKKDYLALCKKIWQRDGHRCRNPWCSIRGNFSPHHIVFRSKIRLDTSQNLITLCQKCHDKIHAYRLKIVNIRYPDLPANANEEVFFYNPRTDRFTISAPVQAIYPKFKKERL